MTFSKSQLALGIAAATLSVAMQAQAADSKAERVADATAILPIAQHSSPLHGPFAYKGKPHHKSLY